MIFRIFCFCFLLYRFFFAFFALFRFFSFFFHSFLLFRCVETLIKHDAKTLAQDNDDFNPLHWAARTGQDANIELIIEHSQTVLYSPEGVGITSSKQFTPLHLAARYGHETALEKLEQLVVDPDNMDKEKCTPLWYAGRWLNLVVFGG